MAGVYNITADQGSTFLFAITWMQSDGVTPVNMTGYGAHMQVRSRLGATDLEIDASTANGMIVVHATTGVVAVNVPASIMTTITAPASYKYDLDVYSSDATPIVTRLVQGSFKVTAEVTIL